MKDEFVKNIGVWGQRHYAYLKKHSPTVINVMIELIAEYVDARFEDYFAVLEK